MISIKRGISFSFCLITTFIIPSSIEVLIGSKSSSKLPALMLFKLVLEFKHVWFSS
ncbi:MAG: hypothetical protein ACTSRI_20070 [Promethearchaeota archaeon]